MCERFFIDGNNNIAEMRIIFAELKRHYSGTYEFLKLKKGEIFPSDTVPVIIPEKELRIDTVPMQWGIKGLNGKLIINARCEGVGQKSIFRDSINNKRCIIPSNGFYEWAKAPSGEKKEKYLIKPAQVPMLYLAGIYEKLPDPVVAGKEQVRFVIMTKEARGLIHSLHNRMPVAVERKDILKWLNGNRSDIAEIFRDTKVPEYTFENLGVVG